MHSVERGQEETGGSNCLTACLRTTWFDTMCSVKVWLLIRRDPIAQLLMITQHLVDLKATRVHVSSHSLEEECRACFADEQEAHILSDRVQSSLAQRALGPRRCPEQQPVVL